MATKGEKVRFTILGAGIDILAGLIRASNENSKMTFKEGLWRALRGGVLGRVSAEVLGTPNNTVNYTLKRGRRPVYGGITYEDRIDKRIEEHIRDGKQFDSVVVSSPKPRGEALEVEKKWIKRNRPLYNKQHNF